MHNSLVTVTVVVVLVPLRLDKSYYYLLPHDIETIKPGTIISVTFGHKAYSAIALELRQISKTESLKLKLRAVDKIYFNICLSPELIKFAKFFAQYTLTPLGLVANMLLRGFAGTIKLPQIDYISVSEHALPPESLTPKRMQVLTAAASREIWQKSQLAKAANVTPAVVTKLVTLGFLRQRKCEYIAPKLLPDYYATKLSLEQETAAAKLCTIVSQQRFATILLSGITGSGKTEVYFEALAKLLQQQGQALILLPEIALTQQFLERFKMRFGAKPAVWHSALNKKQRHLIWQQIATREIEVLVGARSALFLPFNNLQLIIVDEEHDASYKQEENIFYSARDMAVARAKFGNFPVVLSSATPSIESVVNANSGKYKLIELKQRYGAGQLPKLSLIDMSKISMPKNKFLAPSLVEAITINLAKQQQSILFLGRRGYAPVTICRACGYRLPCPNCSAFLTEHKFHQALLCHHCGFTQELTTGCPECKKEGQLAACGGGIERIAEEVKALLPSARLMLLSTDLSANIGLMRQQLADISDGKVDIIIGTQLISKGHNFPKVSLVGVIDADLGLNNSDLRAAERTYQILAQVTGRAGRHSAESSGIIQTYSPQHPVIQALLTNDKESFYTQEISMRAQAHMPPFSRLASIIVSSFDDQAAQNYARILRQTVPSVANIVVLGPAQAPLIMIRNQYRYRLLVKTEKTIDIQHFLRQWLNAAPKASSAIKLQIDVDPQSFF